MLRTDAFVGNRKMKYKWSNECYEVICQNGDVPTYDIKDKNGKVKTIHCNHLLFEETAEAVSLEPQVQSTQTTEVSGNPHWMMLP